MSCLPTTRRSRARRTLFIGVLALLSVGNAQASDAVSYGRDIRPILSDRCFQCHGPDANKRQADLRLDTFEFATSKRNGIAAIVPGRAEASELFLRISTDDPDGLMPPKEAHRKALSGEELALFERWIDEGASYEEHWAFAPPIRPELADESRHPIDGFVARELREHGLQLSPRIEPELALRRLFLDLTGLPPTPEELDEFLSQRADGNPDDVWLAWIRRIFVEEPYKSRYAERMTSPWLDQARYADTSGIHMDAGRQIWPWRDWVLRAYRENMPYDRFVVEQLAGDLLPEATLDQIVASGFNRNHVTTDEGGAIDAEYLVEYAADRVETTSSVFLGLTMTCTRCHDHKFDPLTQEDYYGLFAFFGSNQEPGLYSQRPDPNRAFEPFIEVPTAEDEQQRAEITAALETERAELAEPSAEDRAALAEFRQELPTRLGLEWVAAQVFEATSAEGAKLVVDDKGRILSEGVAPDTDIQRIHLRTEATDLRLIQLDVLGHESFTNGAPGRAANGNAVLTGFEVEAISLLNPEERRSLPVSWLWADAHQTNEDWSLYRALDDRHNSGWAIAGHTDGSERVALFLTEEPFGFEGGTEVVVTLKFESIYVQHAFGHVRVALAKLGDEGLASLPLAQGHWYHAGPFPIEDGGQAYALDFGPERAVSLDLDQEFELATGGTRRWLFKAEFSDGATQTLPAGVNVNYVGREIYSPDARQVEVSLGSDDGFALYLNGEEVARREVPRGVAPDQDRATLDLRAGRNSFVFKVINTGGAAGFYFQALEQAERLSEDLITALVETSVRADGGSTFDERIDHAWRLDRSPEYKAGLERIAALETRQTELEAGIPRTMVMRERMEPRPTFVLERGVYDGGNEERPVVPSVPAVFGELECVDESGAPRRATRLDLAEWMTSGENPLVARVAVNRLWQLLFGRGLVATSGDFGYQGSWPSHPELLDWLAVEFVENGWDVQALLTTIVTSETYQQSSHVRPEVREVDPEGFLLANFPRRRLDAESLRDQALFVSGLLVEKLGGPSVKPYHPEGLWQEVAMLQSNTRFYERGSGDDLWRRTLYTYWKRACPPPALLTFDAPTREACVIQRSTTNTPLQALVLWNDEQYVEAARVLAERTLLANADESERGIREMFRRCTGRLPSARELELLSAALDDHRSRYRESPEDAEALIAVGERERDPALDAGELAAWTVLASAILNLHATITQG